MRHFTTTHLIHRVKSIAADIEYRQAHFSGSDQQKMELIRRRQQLASAQARLIAMAS